MRSYQENQFDNILKNDLCLGCGLCEAIGKESGYRMTLSQTGFYVPGRPHKRNIEVERKITSVCPSINVQAPKLKSDNLWGNTTGIYNVSANDPVVRKKGASGGGVSALCIFLLETNKVDAILHIGKVPGNSIENELFVSKTKNEIISNASSRYAPAKILNKIQEIFESSHEVYAFVGKPCDIAAVKNYIALNKEYEGRIKYFISFFCAGMPSYLGTLKLLETANRKALPHSLKYRGNGWPGHFEATYDDQHFIKMSYDESWGNVLGRHLHSRCKICPDAIGLMADIVFGDSWETKNGYPDFDEKDGVSLVIARTKTGDSLLHDALEASYLSVDLLEKERLITMQPYQYQRRLFVGYRLLIAQLFTGFLLHFKNTGMFQNMRQYSVRKGIKVSLGTLKRFNAKRKTQRSNN